jgi:hypothetical protein
MLSIAFSTTAPMPIVAVVVESPGTSDGEYAGPPSLRLLWAAFLVLDLTPAHDPLRTFGPNVCFDPKRTSGEERWGLEKRAECPEEAASALVKVVDSGRFEAELA